ncbi:hypothetical protein [Alloactinosynnema sp. L-07]|nr:hypothetical protein [Alloactinosynnema sp. L-07]
MTTSPSTSPATVATPAAAQGRSTPSSLGRHRRERPAARAGRTRRTRPGHRRRPRHPPPRRALIERMDARAGASPTTD